MAKKNKQPNMQKRPSTFVAKEESPEEVKIRLELRYLALSRGYKNANRFRIQYQAVGGKWINVTLVVPPVRLDVGDPKDEDDQTPEAYSDQEDVFYEQHRGLAIEEAGRYAEANPNTYVRVVDLFKKNAKGFPSTVLRPIIRKNFKQQVA